MPSAWYTILVAIGFLVEAAYIVSLSTPEQRHAYLHTLPFGFFAVGVPVSAEAEEAEALG